MINRSLAVACIVFLTTNNYGMLQSAQQGSMPEKFFAQTGDGACSGLRALLQQASLLSSSTKREVLLFKIEETVTLCGDRAEAIALHDQKGAFSSGALLHLADHYVVARLGEYHKIFSVLDGMEKFKQASVPEQ